MSSRRARLMAATRRSHQQVEARIEREGLMESLSGYGCFLAAMHRFHDCVEWALRTAVRDGVVSNWWPADRVSLLDRDLQALGVPHAPRPDPPQLGDRGAVLGLRYVAEGSALGATQLLPRVRALGVDAGRGADFLFGHAAASGRWKAFVHELEHATLDPYEETSLERAAVAGFLLVDRCLDAPLQTLEA